MNYFNSTYIYNKDTKKGQLMSLFQVVRLKSDLHRHYDVRVYFFLAARFFEHFKRENKRFAMSPLCNIYYQYSGLLSASTQYESPVIGSISSLTND